MIRLQPARRVVLFGILPALVCCLALGCGGAKTYRVSGKVTFKGNPIPVGKIVFTPDKSKGGTGPAGYAVIKDGNYDTSAAGGSGVVGGPMIISIQAAESEGDIDKPAKALFPQYQTTADLPKSDSTKDIDVPADAVKGPKKG
jgi:hypothetical protein